MNTRILLADDHQIVREGLRSLIEKQPDMEVVGEADNGRDAVELARECAPHLVIMDIGMPDLNGIEAAHQILAARESTRIIALSMHKDGRFVSRMLEAGAAGYLLKESAFDELVRAVRQVMSGNTYLSPGVTGTVVDEYVRHRPGKDEVFVEASLTPREREVLQLIAEGESTKEIAARLDVSVKTIETHRRHIMDKLDIHSVAELTKYALRAGMTSLD